MAIRAGYQLSGLGLLGLLLISLTSQCLANVVVVAEYRLGASTAQITYTGGPEIMVDATGNNKELKREGNPRFVASAPSVPSAKGAGALEFDGKHDAYVRTGALFDITDRFGLEVWVNASEASVKGLKGVVANGNGARGYVLGQSGNRWVAFVGCVGAFDLGPVTPGRWTHLALVHDGKELAAYLDGEKIRAASPTPAVDPVFRIGTAGLPEEHFKGIIHVVRVFMLGTGRFDPDSEFLLDNELRQKVAQQNREEQSAFIRGLCALQPGVSVVKKLELQPAPRDWLIAPPNQSVQLQVEPASYGQSARLALGNGLISRSFYVGRNVACFSYRSLRNRAEFIRAVKPEMRVKLDGTWYEVGGLVGQPERSYLVEAWLQDMKSSPNKFRFIGLKTGQPIERHAWKPKFNAPQIPWPPKGLRVSMQYAAPEAAGPRYQSLRLMVHYEMYENLPVLSKSFTLENGTGEPVLVEEIETEILAVPQDQIENIHADMLRMIATPWAIIPRPLTGIHRCTWQDARRPTGAWTRSMIPGHIRRRSKTSSSAIPSAISWSATSRWGRRSSSRRARASSRTSLSSCFRTAATASGVRSGCGGCTARYAHRSTKACSRLAPLRTTLP
ncbi:MAG: LamG domain-containing protein [Verrucomicrobia bacterium]|nr:LamG domain-containing protein [Verrucomicrobiota bacterium]